MTKKLKILIVEDNPMDAEMIKLHLKKDGLSFDTRTIGTLDKLRSSLSDFQPDIILSDYNLPGFTGVDVMKVVKEYHPMLPFIIVTGALDDETAASCIKEGAWDYIIKKRMARIGSAVINAIEIKKQREEKEKVLEALTISEGRYRRIFENIQDIYFEMSLEGTLLEVSPSVWYILNFTRDEIIGKRFTDFQGNDSEPIELPGILFHEKSIRNFELKLINGKGGQEDALLNCRIVSDEPANEKIIGSLRLITERKRGEEERNRLAAALEQSADLVMITDAEYHIVYVNPAFSRVTGYAAEEILGEHPDFLYSGEHDQAFYDEVYGAINEGRVWSGRIINRKKDGSFYIESGSISPIRDITGNVVNWVSVKRDISYEVEMEKQLRQSQRLETIGRLAGGMAHDFNNILGTILGYIDIARMVNEGSEKEGHYLDKIEKASLRAKGLIEKILTFSRQSSIEDPVLLDVREIIREVCDGIKSKAPKNIRIKEEYSKEKLKVYGDSDQLFQVFLNLCTNAVQAMEEKGGSLSILAKSMEYKGREHILVEIKDEGCGIPKDVIEKIYEPFFTTKKVGSGTGLGLSVVHGIIKNHHGAVDVESKIGKGSVFSVYLPISKGN